MEQNTSCPQTVPLKWSPSRNYNECRYLIGGRWNVTESELDWTAGILFPFLNDLDPLAKLCGTKRSRIGTFDGF